MIAAILGLPALGGPHMHRAVAVDSREIPRTGVILGRQVFPMPHISSNEHRLPQFHENFGRARRILRLYLMGHGSPQAVPSEPTVARAAWCGALNGGVAGHGTCGEEPMKA